MTPHQYYTLRSIALLIAGTFIASYKFIHLEPL